MGRILGIDYGDSRVGLALSDPTKTIASPYQTISNEGEELLLQKLKNIISEKDIECLVLGLPIGLNGKDTQQTKKVRKFAVAIHVMKLPVYLQDERLSSQSAAKSLIEQNIKTGRNKHLVDERAAAIFLQQYLDYSKNK